MILPLNIQRIEPLPTPRELQHLYSVSEEARHFIHSTRQEISQILTGNSSRRLLIVGPCSIHDPKAALEYAEKLYQLHQRVRDKFLIVMRVYVEKPRSALGWKGLIHDPFLNGSDAIMDGIKISRQLFLRLAESRIPIATEFLELVTSNYLADLVSWGSIGARTAASQPHRQLASALPMPVGFKNSLDGDPSTAIQAVLASQTSQTCLSINPEGQACFIRTQGNPHGHIVLRGSTHQPNYDERSIKHTAALLKNSGLPSKLIVDCSHGNCQKRYEDQVKVFQCLIQQIRQGESSICGLMLESHINPGSQPFSPHTNLHYAVSLTDPCIDWTTTDQLITWAHEML